MVFVSACHSTQQPPLRAVCVPAVHLCHTTHCQGRQRSCARGALGKGGSRTAAEQLHGLGRAGAGLLGGCTRAGLHAQARPLRSAQVRSGPLRSAHCAHTVSTLFAHCAHTRTLCAHCAHTHAHGVHTACATNTHNGAPMARTPGGTRTTARRDCASETAQAEQCYAQRCTVQCTTLHSAVRTVLHSAAQCTALHSASACTVVHCTTALHSSHGAPRQVEPGPRGESGETARRRESGETARRDCAVRGARSVQCALQSVMHAALLLHTVLHRVHGRLHNYSAVHICGLRSFGSSSSYTKPHDYNERYRSNAMLRE